MTENNEKRRRRRTDRSQTLYSVRDWQSDENPAENLEETQSPQLPSLAGAYAPDDANQSTTYDTTMYTPNDEANRQGYPQSVSDISQPAYDESMYAPNEEVGQAPAYAAYDQPSHDEGLYTPNEDAAPAYETYNQPSYDAGAYMPVNRTEAIADAYEEAQSEASIPQVTPVDFSAYYRKDDAADSGDAEPFFAPPIKLKNDEAYVNDDYDQAQDNPQMARGNVYTPLEPTWAKSARMRSIGSAGDIGYQVQDEQDRPHGSRRKKRTIRVLLILAIVLVLAAGAVYILRDKIPAAIQTITGVQTPTDDAFTPVVTPEPIKGYDAAPGTAMAGLAQTAISEISGSVDMETYAVTQSQIIARNARDDGTYDFYLFSAAEGKLLGYFEGLGANDMMPLEGGYAYVKQSPYLLNASGSALIRTSGIEEMMRQNVVLHPILNDWAIIKTEDGLSANYINLEGQLISNLWFARQFPFTGDQTVAYVDTGNVADVETRYLLYVLGQDGSMTKWKSAATMGEVIGSACAFAYMDTGNLYLLPNTQEAVCVADSVDVYLDCNAVVARNIENGKYGLFVDGEQLYGYEYDQIQPVQSDMQWDKRILSGTRGSFTVHAVTGATYPQPLSHYFLLTKDGQEELVALSTESTFPILLDGEF